MNKLAKSLCVAAAAMLCVPSAQAAPIENIRTVQGELYTFIEDEARDCIHALIDTPGGVRYSVRDFVAPRGSTCVIVFDTHGTEDMRDDTILHILTVWTNEGGENKNV